MIVLYTSPGCASCRKVKKFLNENNLEFVEKNIITLPLNEIELKHLIQRSENGTSDGVSMPVTEKGSDSLESEPTN